MTRAFRKAGGQIRAFFGNALVFRAPDRQYGVAAWALIAGAFWLPSVLAGSRGWILPTLAGCFLLALLASVCAVDGRYGIIPNSVVLALAVGGTVQTYLLGEAGLWWRGYEASTVFVASSLFRAAYRWLRGINGLGFGDVKFVAAGVLWIGIEGIPGLLLIAVASALISLLILKSEGHDLHGQQAIPFGPHLAVGLWWIWLLGPRN